MADDATEAGNDGETVADDPLPEGGDGDLPTDGEGADRGGAASALVFLLGLLGFAGSIVAFVADLVTGFGVVRSLAVNVASAVVLVGWAAIDTLSDPDSSVSSRRGAAGTALLLLGIYLLLWAAVVGVTSLVHDRFAVVPWAAGAGVAAVVVGYLVFPRGLVPDAERDGDADVTESDSDAASGADESGPEKSGE